jgi:hypothetical protein
MDGLESQRTRLLILACSRAKRHDPGLLPAVERYDGPMFRVLRRFQRLDPSAPLDVLILSAEFGLIGGSQPIPFYDREMTASRAAELQPTICHSLRHILDINDYADVLICMSACYRHVLTKPCEDVVGETRVAVSTSARGKALADLYYWLYSQRAGQVP